MKGEEGREGEHVKCHLPLVKLKLRNVEPKRVCTVVKIIAKKIDTTIQRKKKHKKPMRYIQKEKREM